MSLTVLPRDVWRIIGKWLTKADLLALQIAVPRLRLDSVPEIWFGKHFDMYILMWNAHFNGTALPKQLKAIYPTFGLHYCCRSGKYHIESLLLVSVGITLVKSHIGCFAQGFSGDE